MSALVRLMRHSVGPLAARLSAPLAMAAALAVLGGAPARAACSDAAWPLDTEAAALQGAAASPVLPDGATLALEGNRAVMLRLQPWSMAALPRPPERAPKDAASFAGYARGNADTAGIYQITLPEAAWIDLM